MKYLVIDMYTLNFVNYLESDISEEDIDDMDYCEKEDTFNLSEGEMIFSPKTLKEQLIKLQELLDNDGCYK